MKLKKMLSVFLALLMLLGCLPALEAFAASKPASDTYCPSERSGNHTHGWGDWDITQEATCSHTGKRVRVCRYCDYVQTQTSRTSN